MCVVENILQAILDKFTKKRDKDHLTKYLFIFQCVAIWKYLFPRTKPSAAYGLIVTESHQ